jgi:hypothetical protein
MAMVATGPMPGNTLQTACKNTTDQGVERLIGVKATAETRKIGNQIHFFIRAGGLNG